jgi:ABC-2 type transport system permease protein
MRSAFWRSFKTAAWLGWQIESNWADPFLFFIYSILRPVTGATIVIVMYSIITKGDFASPLFAYMFIGNCFFQYVAAILTGVSWSIVDDREHYKTLKYIYTAPVIIPVYLLGRGVARFLTSSFAVLVLMIFGVVFFKLPIHFQSVDWGLFLVSLVIGILMLSMMGILLAGITLLIVRQNFFIGDVVAGAVFIFCGVIFPMNLLPPGLDKVGYFLPISYWIELIRRAFIGEVNEAFPTFAGWSNLNLILLLVGLTVAFGVIGLVVFRICDHSAREKGYIDWVTSY